MSPGGRADLRPATRDDEPFIAAMLAEAASWERALDEPPYPLDDLLAIPEIADYVEDWGAGRGRRRDRRGRRRARRRAV